MSVVSDRLTVREDRLTGEKVYYTTHPTGVKIAICPKTNYQSAYAIFGTRYGSIDNRFRLNGGEWVQVPDGIAHYLEHKLFENEDSGAFERYAATGACANAYTSFDKTCYLFSCSKDRFEPSFEILLDFVQTPYFTPETVEKERGIIAQELKMYEDSPYSRVYFNLMRAMYEKHPARIDIGGTVESIADITADLLYQCYDAFYHPANMVLAVAGNVDPERVLAICDRRLQAKPPLHIERSYPEDGGSVGQRLIEQHFEVPVPLFQLGFRNPYRKLTDRELVLTDIISDAVFGSISDFYLKMVKKGLINRTIGSDYVYLDGVWATILAGQSVSPESVRDEIFAEIERVKAKGIPPELFECARRKLYAAMVESFNNIDDIGDFLADDLLFGTDCFDQLQAVAEVTVEDGNACFREQFDTNNSTLSIIRNQKECQ